MFKRFVVSGLVFRAMNTKALVLKQDDIMETQTNEEALEWLDAMEIGFELPDCEELSQTED